MTNNFDHNEIINDEEFKKMLNSNDYEEVYELLRNYSLKISIKFSFNNELQNKLRDRLFIYYLMVSKQTYKRRNVFEKVLIKMNSDLSDDVSVIKTKYNIDGAEGTIAIIGPKRMEYDRVVALLDYIKNNLGGDNE